ncbi:glycosyltransferase family 4 protein [Thermomonas brevis]|uniref:Glycosyltransferase family 4 protein n=1 Tax=Thermomonas brevis TaxID=215691 RepID=A0A7G9QUE3_9GAMM|nr:glycosyltransferase family 4 protein [Thermomonas brevis]QNN46968.1 glycosyltransferase family 4 protein [Thermomonas brevis]
MKVVLFANTDWYLWNFRRSLALALRDAGYEVVLLSPDGPYGEKIRACGLHWQPAPMDRRSLNPLREALLLWHLVRLFRYERPDVVHGFTIKCVVYGSLAARLAGVPARVNAVAGMGYVFTSQSWRARALRPLVRGLLHLALGGRNARLILQNPDDVALFRKARLLDLERARLIPGSGVDCRRFAQGPVRSSVDRVQALLPARLLWDKGVAEYVEAARLLRERQVPVDLLLAGTPDPGNPAAVPESAVREWVSEGLLQWLGHVDDMPTLFRSVQIVALPSYREGLPKGLIEAGASGCALVTTDVPGCREVVTHEVDGLLVPVKDSGTLADAIERLVWDPVLRHRLGVAAREKAVAQFDERIVLARTLDVYAELLGSA